MRQYTEPSQHHLHLLTSRILNKAQLFCVLAVSAGVRRLDLIRNLSGAAVRCKSFDSWARSFQGVA